MRNFKKSGSAFAPVDIETNEDKSAPADSDSRSNMLVNNERRNCLKIMSGAVAGAVSMHSLTGAAAPLESGSSIHQPVHAELPEPGQMIPNLTVNINFNRSDLPDWMLIENLREEPLVLKQFAPRWVEYKEHVLDLEAMLTRQQRGRKQLEIWPNHAWTHSLKGAVHALHDCGSIEGNCIDARQAGKAALFAGHRSLQLSARVDSSGAVTLLAV